MNEFLFFVHYLSFMMCTMAEEMPSHVTTDKKTWKAYCYLEEIARERGYKTIGLTHAYSIIGGKLGLTSRTSTTIKDILKRLANPPFEWITIDSAQQISVKPKFKVLKESDTKQQQLEKLG